MAAQERDAIGRPRIGVSSCLLGDPVRYNGGHSRCRFLTDELAPYVDWVPFCPEMEIGLGTPRETLRLTADDRLVSRSLAADHTAAMAALPLAPGLDGQVFKARSPSCGIRGIPRYGADGRPADRRGRGVYAARLIDADPLLPVEDEGRLNDAGLREAFVERVFARARLRELFEGDWRPRDLVAFHTRHKVQILAHDPAGYRLAGRVVARAGDRPREETEAAYRELFDAALARKATRGRNANALQHVFGLISEVLDDTRRHDIVASIEEYRLGGAPLSLPVALLSHHARGEGIAWAADQTFLAPFPAALHLRHHL
ncbi:DUF523 and DUF1722 domain-containing protein [Actinoallomurus spadix]|uniref:DUF523 and DUF1722 domain-containing protein n=1 Tax=Actinoallomurus spadix TaxID=79912 RepID=A0ABN0WNW7_9ACTN|nr:DUF523 and DUF1722 domain-containing protein [Actinoallomurus spadix]MCO5984749.1 DUF523 and DUF1722 domain-containing protein [Actinoallomurus spadix]